MSKYRVDVTETLRRIIDVEADNALEAEKKVHQMYKDSEIVLGADDFVGYRIGEAYRP